MEAAPANRRKPRAVRRLANRNQMLNIKVICVGKLKEKYWTDAITEYSKRLKSYCNLEIIECKESRLPDNAGPAEEEKVKFEEGQEILKRIGKDDYVITLEILGKMLDSEELSRKIDQIALDGSSTIDLIIGGSLGLSPEVSARANYKLSFSKMTFPHQLMRVILLEQVYRAFKISRNEKYHK